MGSLLEGSQRRTARPQQVLGYGCKQCVVLSARARPDPISVPISRVQGQNECVCTLDVIHTYYLDCLALQGARRGPFPEHTPSAPGPFAVTRVFRWTLSQQPMRTLSIALLLHAPSALFPAGESACCPAKRCPRMRSRLLAHRAPTVSSGHRNRATGK